MSTTRSFLLIVALCAFAASVDSTRPEPYDICSLGCVKRIFKKYCGGTPCVFGPTNKVEKAYLCSEPCIEALSGPYMFQCLQEKDPYRLDFDLVISTKLQEVTGFCEEEIASVGAIEVEEEELLDYPDRD